MRKAADSEFIYRLGVCIPGAQVVLKDILSFVRLTDDSLSRADFSSMWKHSSRVEYWESAQKWHQEVRRGESALIDTSGVTRSFPAPRRMLGVAAESQATIQFDLLIAADWSDGSLSARRSGALLHAAVAAGLKVAIIDLSSQRNSQQSRPPTASEVRELLYSGQIVKILETDVCRAALLVVDSAPSLEWVEHIRWACVVDSAVVMADDAPAEAARASFWSIVDCSRAMTAVFDVTPRWHATSVDLQQALDDVGVKATVGDVEYIVNYPWIPARPRGLRSTPVIGRVAPLRANGWAASGSDLRAAYPCDGSIDVRILGDTNAIERAFGERPVSWLVYRDRDIDLPAFLFQLDFYVHLSDQLPSRWEVEEILAAVAAKRVVVLDSRFEPSFGTLALYATASEVARTVRSYHDDPKQYERQVSRANDELSRRFDPDAPSRLLRSLLA